MTRQRPRLQGATPTIVNGAPVPILIVDDNPAKRLATMAVLSPLGYRVVEADSGLAALRCVMSEDFAVILLDIRMPIMDGFETAALIRQRRRSEMTPIIFVTAFRSDEMMQADHYAIHGAPMGSGRSSEDAPGGPRLRPTAAT